MDCNEKVKNYIYLTDSISKDGYLERVRSDLFISGKRINPEDVELDKPYYLATGFGGIYKNDYSLGYFKRGALITFTLRADEFFIAKMSGDTFKVTTDASFGNTPSTFSHGTMEAEGRINNKHFPHILDLDYVIKEMEKIVYSD